MDHRQKSKIKIEEEDDDDVEKLRLAALRTMGMGTKKDTAHKKLVVLQMQKVLPQTAHPPCFPRYKNQRPTKKNMYYNRAQQRQNGNVYYPSPRNPNLIAIVPVDEPSPLQQAQPTCPTEPVESYPPQDQETSKFCRFKDNGSASEEEDTKESKTIITAAKTESVAEEKPREFLLEKESQEEATENLQKNGDDQKEDSNNDDDDDDIILMADLEEEDSLERLMDEMEKEMNDGNKSSEKKEKKLSKTESEETIKVDEGNKPLDQRATRSDESLGKKERSNTCISSSLVTGGKNDRRSISPHVTNRGGQKRKSSSPRSRSRKKSPRRSPRRSPIRQQKRSPRESTRYRSPRRSPLSRYSPRPRLSPRLLSPRRSPNRTSAKKSPLRKLSPRGRSPGFSSRSRSPRLHRSRSPRRSKSPKSCSPKVSHSRSPSLRYSPLRSPKSKSPPRPSPRRTSPRRLRSRSRSPGLSPPRRDASRLRSPKGSPRRTPPRGRSPHRSPWSSPKHSPSRLSPRRRRSPKWSPKELPRKHGPSSVTPDNRDGYARDTSPAFKDTAPPEISRVKAKQKDEIYERSTTAATTITTTTTTTTTTETAKESVDPINDPVREARKKKFESTRPIDPIHANKKIKLSKKVVTNTKGAEPPLETEVQLSGARKASKSTPEEYDLQEADIFSEDTYEFEEFEGAENTSPGAVNACIDVESKKPEKERKKRKHDKELYQVGKLKNELPLSERIGKDKKCKKRKEIVSEENVEVFEDVAVEEEGDLRAELSRRRAERLNRTVPMQSARLVQSAFKGVVNEVVKNNAKANQRHVINTDDKSNQKEVRRVTVLHRSLHELHDSDDEGTVDSKVPVRFRLGLNKQESRESKVTRKTSKRQGRKE